jgi:hypothetical protein
LEENGAVDTAPSPEGDSDEDNGQDDQDVELTDVMTQDLPELGEVFSSCVAQSRDVLKNVSAEFSWTCVCIEPSLCESPSLLHQLAGPSAL